MTASRIEVIFLPTSSLDVLGILLRIFTVGLEKEVAGRAALGVEESAGDGTSTLGAIGGAEGGGIEAELVGS